MFSCNGQRLKQREMLKTMPMPSLPGLAGRGDRDRPALPRGYCPSGRLSTPNSILTSVDLPAPFRQERVNFARALLSRSISLRARY